MNYSWQHPNWPGFRYTPEGLEDILFGFCRTDRVSGLLAGLTANTHAEAIIGQMVSEAIKTSEIEKARFFDRFESQLNERQLKVVRRMLEEGPSGFEEGMNAKKYVSIATTSKATATRDLQGLAEKKYSYRPEEAAVRAMR